MEEKISVIMPNFNGDKYLEKAINSFLNQDYKNKELIIVDGKSTDTSHNIISEKQLKYPNFIKWIQAPDTGISNAFNIGLSHATGTIVGYLGSDDLLYKNIFNEINYHFKNIHFDAIYFNSYTYHINKNNCQFRKCPELEFNKENLLKFGTIVGWQNIYFKKKIYDKYKIDEKNKFSMDYEFYLRISHENYLYLYVNEVCSINIFDNNISTDSDAKQYNEAANVAKLYSEGFNDFSYYPIGKSSRKQTKSSFVRKVINRIKSL